MDRDPSRGASGLPVPLSVCEGCGRRLEGATCVTEQRAAPRSGDISFCAYCGQVRIFGPDLRLRRPTAEESARLEANPQVRRARAAVLLIRGARN